MRIFRARVCVTRCAGLLIGNQLLCFFLFCFNIDNRFAQVNDALHKNSVIYTDRSPYSACIYVQSEERQALLTIVRTMCHELCRCHGATMQVIKLKREKEDIFRDCVQRVADFPDRKELREGDPTYFDLIWDRYAAATWIDATLPLT